MNHKVRRASAAMAALVAAGAFASSAQAANVVIGSNFGEFTGITDAPAGQNDYYLTTSAGSIGGYNPGAGNSVRVTIRFGGDCNAPGAVQNQSPLTTGGGAPSNTVVTAAPQPTTAGSYTATINISGGVSSAYCQAFDVRTASTVSTTVQSTVTPKLDLGIAGAGGSCAAPGLTSTTTLQNGGTQFTPSVNPVDYTGSSTLCYTSTAGTAYITAEDVNTSASKGFLVNSTTPGPTTLQNPLLISSSAPTATFQPYPVTGLATDLPLNVPAPVQIAVLPGPITNAAQTVSFKQKINGGEALRSGTYAATIRFTLSTSTP